MSGRPPAAPVPERLALERGHHAVPHRLLGAHPCKGGAVVRAFHPDAVAVDAIVGGRTVPLAREGDGGMWSGLAPAALPPFAHRLRFRFADGNTWEIDDPYRFEPTLGEVDLHLLAEGTHRRAWERLGAHVRTVDGVEGVAFTVWAPNAKAVSVFGDFCAWDRRLLPLRRVGSTGIFELFVPGVREGQHYKLRVLGADGVERIKADPCARWTERSPGWASRVFRSRHEWGDLAWRERRLTRDWAREALSFYEVHLGSWRRGEGGRLLGYREIAPALADHALALGFTHVELMPIAEHPFEPSWGYQVSGYFAPTSRFGDPDDFRFFVDHLHQRGLGVVLDWVPGHFVKDDWALARFDGTALYEHDDPRRGEHPDWGTSVFNHGRAEVRNFLVANALYWLDEFHVDGLRVDAVASMLYLDYSRKDGEWIPNAHGGREDLDAIELLRQVNGLVRTEHAGCITIAEESTAWPGVTAPPSMGGLGFTFKWNMGWMNDTLRYFATPPAGRRSEHDRLTFAMLYERSERFVNPLSHDEVVHGKGSLLAKMPGDRAQRFANLRMLLGYQWLRPGKKLLFMGSELAPEHEWNQDVELPWAARLDPLHAGVERWLAALGREYRGHPALWERDHDEDGFRWIDCSDREQGVVSWLRQGGGEGLVVILNLSTARRRGYRVGTPHSGWHAVLLCSDDAAYGGGGGAGRAGFDAEAEPMHGHARSIAVDLPPLCVMLLAPRNS